VMQDVPFEAHRIATDFGKPAQVGNILDCTLEILNVKEGERHWESRLVSVQFMDYGGR